MSMAVKWKREKIKNGNKACRIDWMDFKVRIMQLKFYELITFRSPILYIFSNMCTLFNIYHIGSPLKGMGKTKMKGISVILSKIRTYLIHMETLCTLFEEIWKKGTGGY